MEKLKELLSRCKSTVEIRYNPHKSYYDAIVEYIGDDDIKYVEKDVLDKMINQDTLVCIQFYPHSSVGFYTVYHYDIEQAIERALTILNEDK